MATIIDIFWAIFMASEFFIITGTFCYLKREYSKAATVFIEKCNKTEPPIKKKNASKKLSHKKFIKFNDTQSINTQKINDQMGYAQLIFLRSGYPISSKKMSQTKLRIGRDPRNDIVIKERTVSRQQCLISKRNNKFVIKNFSQKNFTQVNDNIIKDKADLKYGDKIKMGTITLLFEEATSEYPLERMYK